MTDRITRTYWLRYPRWRSRYERPVNLALFRWFDGLPLLVGFALASVVDPNGSFMSVIAVVLAVWYFGLFPVVFGLRLRARARWCAEHGHTPYRPVPEVDEWRCVLCDEPVGVSPEMVSVSVARAAAEGRLRRSQAFYSDRR